MIISCEKCNKKFNIDPKLIPPTGRLLQCGSCQHKWNYVPQSFKANEIQTEKKIKEKKETTPNIEKIIDKVEITEDQDKNKKINKKNKKKQIGFLSYLLVFIISIIAFIIIIDTFKTQISIILPNINLYLNELYETLRDIILFFKDLIN
tara:strand:+ start:138 stop:584 length:447 start_codon:yes stop_codon:yes gene_type:complete